MKFLTSTRPKESECKRCKRRTNYWKESFKNLIVLKNKISKRKSRYKRLSRGSKMSMPRHNENLSDIEILSANRISGKTLLENRTNLIFTDIL